MARGESSFHIKVFLFVFCCLSSTQPFSPVPPSISLDPSPVPEARSSHIKGINNVAAAVIDCILKINSYVVRYYSIIQMLKVKRK